MADDEPERCETETIVDRHIAQLAEHFEVVRVFVVKQVRGESGPEHASYSSGAGNFYAQIGLIKDWVISQDHRTRVAVERQSESEEGE